MADERKGRPFVGPAPSAFFGSGLFRMEGGRAGVAVRLQLRRREPELGGAGPVARARLELPGLARHVRDRRVASAVLAVGAYRGVKVLERFLNMPRAGAREP